MTPIEKCKMLYTPQSPRTFEEDMMAHLAHGYFFSTPEYVMMARPVAAASANRSSRAKPAATSIRPPEPAASLAKGLVKSCMELVFHLAVFAVGIVLLITAANDPDLW